MKLHILLLFITENLLTVDGAEAGHTTVGLVIAVVLTVVLVRFNNQYCHTLDLKLITRVNILLSFVVLKSFKSAHYLSFFYTTFAFAVQRYKNYLTYASILLTIFILYLHF